MPPSKTPIMLAKVNYQQPTCTFSIPPRLASLLSSSCHDSRTQLDFKLLHGTRTRLSSLCAAAFVYLSECSSSSLIGALSVGAHILLSLFCRCASRTELANGACAKLISIH